MTTITLIRTAEIAGQEQPVTVTGEVLNETENYLEMRVSQNVISNLPDDWKAGEVVRFNHQLINQ